MHQEMRKGKERCENSEDLEEDYVKEKKIAKKTEK